MLKAVRASHDNEVRLYLRPAPGVVPIVAWIARNPWPRTGPDWQLWFVRNGVALTGKCQLRLEIESRLRAWLLRRYHRPLATMSFADLCAIAEAEPARKDARPLGPGVIDRLLMLRRARNG
jgi:hypothetical protein